MPPDAERGLPRSYHNYDSITSEGNSTVDEAVAERNEVNDLGNEYALGFAFWSFVLFCTVQFVFAVIANSQAMIADSQAMAVDALTYLFNLIAERWKTRAFSQEDVDTLPPEVIEYRRERLRLYLELVPPMMSAIILSIVTITSTREAFASLAGNDDDEDVNVRLMLIFSFANLVLDVFNVTCFARAHHAYGLGEVKKDPMSYSVRAAHAVIESTELLESWKGNSDESERQDHEPRSKFPINLNMCSAWTHVMADTLRSTAVLVAATIAFCCENVQGSIADALATLFVSAIILISLLPLVHGLIATVRSIVELGNSAPVLNV